MAAMRSSDAGGNPSHRACRAASSSSPRDSSSGRESAHSPLHLSRKGRQSNAVDSLMDTMLPPATDNAPPFTAERGAAAENRRDPGRHRRRAFGHHHCRPHRTSLC